MHYIVYNPLSGHVNQKLEGLKKKLTKKGIEFVLINYVEEKIDDILENGTENDYLVICGGDGTINYLIQEGKLKDSKIRVLLFKSGSGNDYAREHKGFLPDITNELKNAPYCIINGQKKYFINGVGMGFDAMVCDSQNNATDDESYFNRGLKLFTSFKNFELDVEVDGVMHHYNKVFLFDCQNGRFMGGGMKIAPRAKRCDDILELYVIRSRHFMKILLLFGLMFPGLHVLFRRNVKHLRGKHFKFKLSSPKHCQADGEVSKDLDELEVFSS